MHRYEANLVREFIEILRRDKKTFGPLSIAREFDYFSGRVDIVGLSRVGELVSFEAKLHLWKTALDQAYRASSFSHLSFVILPRVQIDKPMKYSDEFLRRGVGLCSVSSGRIKIEIPASKRKPFQPWITEAARHFITHF